MIPIRYIDRWGGIHIGHTPPTDHDIQQELDKYELRTEGNTVEVMLLGVLIAIDGTGKWRRKSRQT